MSTFLLDFWDHTWLHILSCWLLQYCDSQPLSNLPQPILFCSSSHGVEYVDSVWVPLDHSSSLVSSVSRIAGSVPCAHNHCFNFCKLAVYVCLAPRDGHCMMCCLSSVSTLHLGHCATDLWPLLCMFLLCANCPVICFDIHLLLYASASCIARSMVYKSSLERSCDKFGIFLFQYARAGGLLSAFHTSCFGFLTAFFRAISKCQGAYGSLYPWGPLCCGVMHSLARRLASMLSQAALDSTVGCPLS